MTWFVFCTRHSFPFKSNTFQHVFVRVPVDYRSSCSSSVPSRLRFPLTDQAAIALSNPSGLWKHTPRYISFEEITGSLMKYAHNKREREGARVWMT